MEAENEELKKRVAGIEGMVANLIVNQQAMVTSFTAQGDRHSGSLDCHHTTLSTLGRFQEKTDANINILVDECSILRTQVESLGDNMCRWLRNKFSVVKVVAELFFSRCREHSHCGDWEDALEYADERSEGSYHTLKVAEENMVPEPTLPPTDQSCPTSDQENIPLRAMSPLPLNVLVPIMEEEVQIRPCCQTTLCQGHSSLDAPSELNPPQRIPSLFKTPLVPQAEG